MAAPTSSGAGWTARVLRGIAVLFLLMDVGLKLMLRPEAIQGTTELGFAASLVQPIGVIELVCLVLYLLPPTSIFGAVLFTGYFGGAIATHVRLGNPLFSHVLFPIYLALFMWGALYLEDPRLRALFPVRR